MTRVLVAGGTGRLGTLVVNGLAASGVQARVLTRDPARAAHLTAAGVEVLVGDVRNRADSMAAAADMDIVVSAVQGFAGPGRGSPASVDRDGNVHLIDAAQASGSEVVLVSVVGAAPDSPFELFRMKYAAERYLTASAVPATIVRATAFLELWIEVLRSTAGRSNRPLVFGRGQNPINFVSVRDVAALVQHAVTERETRGETLEIGGPENLTLTQLARFAAAERGSSIGPRHIPPVALRVLAGTVGRLRPELGRQVRAALAMDRYDLTFTPVDLGAQFAALPATSAAELLATIEKSDRMLRGSGVRSGAVRPRRRR